MVDRAFRYATEKLAQWKRPVEKTAVKAKEWREKHELSREEFFERLPERDQNNLTEALWRIEQATAQLPNDKTAVIAFGSIARPETLRFHPPRDIDVRLLFQSPEGSKQREESIEVVCTSLREILEDARIPYEEDNCTVSEDIVEVISGGKKRLEQAYLNYNNNDPSFLIHFESGLPIHLSIDGVSKPALKKHLSLEQKHNTYFTVLAE